VYTVNRSWRPRQFSLELSPEERLLLALGKLDPPSHDRVLAHRLLGTASFSWREALAIAAAHRVHPMLAYNLERDASLTSRVPTEFRATLRAFRATAITRKQLYTRTIVPVIERLAAEQIQLVLLKGAALLETVYPHGTRVLNDFDILIDKCDYKSVVAAFVEAGFSKRLREGATDASELETYHQIGLAMRLGEALLSVDLHWRLYPGERTFCQMDTPTLLSRVRHIPFGGTSTYVLSREDMLVHYASQLVNDSLNVSYQRMADIYALSRSSLSWESTVDIACRAGSAGATHFALSIASMLGAKVPSWTFRKLRSTCVGCHVSSQYLAVPSLAFRRRASYAIPILVSLLFSRQRDRIRYLRLFLASSWQVSRESRGIVGSCLVAVQGIVRATRLSVELLAPHLPLSASANNGRRMQGNRL
jgi:hypothetical protein